ncbi:hypothetical protein CONLIGDRAFT_419096 [Coniochaeta ligniaria NRRL 30616]|uniref:Defect at low temperature protein 1 n=1 Tax=Coniochaeta ligniaria NRRL 30616 TaxID=1408157 RepID=A0A1J7JHY1_9PEZI|nr:hypothetical protein CONLIGDRAFT_419096 [Coniochaeta ligniaria NRRL 30616]
MTAKKRSPVAVAFRVAYNSIYLILYIILAALILALLADIIRQAIIRKQTFNILVIAITYVVTILVLAFIYAIRLYINRSVLASIPKSYLPIEKGDLKKHVRKMIVASLSRSAAIAYAARPRVAPNFPMQLLGPDGEKAELGQAHKERRSIPPFKLKKTATVEDEMGISLPPCKPVWGEIEHPGWGSPTLPDLPDLQYASVISELPNLIEAKAITLAPPDPESQSDPPMLDPEAVSLLQRTEEMALRDYLTHLIDLGVLEASQTTTDFIAKYEYARFSTRPLPNIRFRELMHLFAEILRSMKPLDPAVLASLIDPDSDDQGPPESDIDNNAPMTPGSDHGNRTPESSIGRSSSSSTGSSRSRVRRAPKNLPVRNSSANTWQHSFRTAPTTPKSKRTAVSRSSSVNSFAQTRNPYPVSRASSGSLRSDAGSVIIRLAEGGDATALPYVLTLTETRSSAG